MADEDFADDRLDAHDYQAYLANALPPTLQMMKCEISSP
jgi:hypothetical protein